MAIGWQYFYKGKGTGANGYNCDNYFILNAGNGVFTVKAGVTAIVYVTIDGVTTIYNQTYEEDTSYSIIDGQNFISAIAYKK